MGWVKWLNAVSGDWESDGGKWGLGEWMGRGIEWDMGGVLVLFGGCRVVVIIRRILVVVIFIFLASTDKPSTQPPLTFPFPSSSPPTPPLSLSPHSHFPLHYYSSYSYTF